MSKEINDMIAKAKLKLESAKSDLKEGFYDDAVSRAYYSIYHIITAILFIKGLHYSSHSQTIGAFNKEFIKTKIFPNEFGSIIYDLFEDRQEADYDVNSNIDYNIANERIEQAQNILTEIINYINKQI